jgi:hypothetical protein
MRSSAPPSRQVSASGRTKFPTRRTGKEGEWISETVALSREAKAKVDGDSVGWGAHPPPRNSRRTCGRVRQPAPTRAECLRRSSLPLLTPARLTAREARASPFGVTKGPCSLPTSELGSSEHQLLLRSAADTAPPCRCRKQAKLGALGNRGRAPLFIADRRTQKRVRRGLRRRTLPKQAPRGGIGAPAST